MTDVLHDEDVLAPAALRRQAAIDPDLIAQQTKHLLTVLGWVFAGPPLRKEWGLAALLGLPALAAVKGYLDYYKVHLTVLARMLAAVHKAEPLGDAISQLEGNLDEYSTRAAEVARRARSETPSTPWAGMSGATALLAVLGAPVLKRDPSFVTAWNTHLAVYEKLVEGAVAVARYHEEQGDAIVRETKARLPELRNAIAATTVTSLDRVATFRYAERVDWMELYLGTRVQAARVAVRDAATHLEQGPLSEGRLAQRL